MTFSSLRVALRLEALGKRRRAGLSHGHLDGVDGETKQAEDQASARCWHVSPNRMVVEEGAAVTRLGSMGGAAC